LRRSRNRERQQRRPCRDNARQSSWEPGPFHPGIMAQSAGRGNRLMINGGVSSRRDKPARPR
jgi:hypothetical protein